MWFAIKNIWIILGGVLTLFLVAPLWSPVRMLCRTLRVLITFLSLRSLRFGRFGRNKFLWSLRLYIHRQHTLINDRLITVHQDINVFALHRERERNRNINEFTKQWIIWLHQSEQIQFGIYDFQTTLQITHARLALGIFLRLNNILYGVIRDNNIPRRHLDLVLNLGQQVLSRNNSLLLGIITLGLNPVHTVFQNRVH